MEILFIPICYELDRILTSTNQTNYIYFHNRFGLYVRLFPLINVICTYSENLLLVFLSINVFDLVSVKCLNLCVVLRFNYQGNHVVYI